MGRISNRFISFGILYITFFTLLNCLYLILKIILCIQSSVFWTIVIGLMLFTIVVYGKNFEITWWMHAICWGFPTILTFIIYVNATFGAPDGTGWCFIVPNDDAPSWSTEFWYWFGKERIH